MMYNMQRMGTWKLRRPDSKNVTISNFIIVSLDQGQYRVYTVLSEKIGVLRRVRWSTRRPLLSDRQGSSTIIETLNKLKTPPWTESY